ncbi:hypothetical protein [Actinophytocola sp.]|uniref:hypothetical protein n=1 Tax=Actinophytocola sp. TaxID=1872138 RepID=UPI002D8112C7|nr:hypothetical protein [Actinophytocola sp.]HET9143083.1 hypothetical protein [Actinophytocola sp.]
MNIEQGIKELRGRGFVFQTVSDESGDLCVLVGTYGWPDCYDRLHIWGEDDAVAARMVPGFRPGSDDVLWSFEDGALGVIQALLDLPAPDQHGAPRLARRAPDGLWLPPSVARASARAG